MSEQEKEIEIELRSEEVQEILTHIPHWMIRWGNLLILIIILLVFMFSWIVKYPDIITTQITITTQVPPEKLIAKSTGKIEKIFVKDKELVSENSPLAVIENPASYNDVFLLKAIVDTISINNENFIFPLEKLPNLRLGIIESSYALFEKDYLAYKLNKELDPYQIDLNAQNIETTQLKERLNLLLEQKIFGETELKYKKQELERNKKLYGKELPVINTGFDRLEYVLDVLLSSKKELLEKMAIEKMNIFKEYWNEKIVCEEYFKLYNSI